MDKLTLLINEAGVWGFANLDEYRNRGYQCINSNYLPLEDCIKNKAVMDRNKLKLESCSTKEREEYTQERLDLLDRLLQHLYISQVEKLKGIFNSDIVDQKINELEDYYTNK